MLFTMIDHNHEREIGRLIRLIVFFYLEQGKFIRIHFGPSGKLAGADIETCEYFTQHIFRIIPEKKSSRGC